MVSTLDFESSDPSSSLGRTCPFQNCKSSLEKVELFLQAKDSLEWAEKKIKIESTLLSLTTWKQHNNSVKFQYKYQLPIWGEFKLVFECSRYSCHLMLMVMLYIELLKKRNRNK